MFYLFIFYLRFVSALFSLLSYLIGALLFSFISFTPTDNCTDVVFVCNTLFARNLLDLLFKNFTGLTERH